MQSKLHAVFAATTLLATVLGGCATQVGDDTGAVGQLQLPLSTTGSQGTTFLLTGTFDLVGVETLQSTVAITDANVTDPTLVFNPRIGSYGLTLSNWAIWEGPVGGSTAMPRTDAMLQSPVMQTVDIFQNQTTFVSYQFFVPGSGTVVYATGSLEIDFDVGEGLPDGSACTSDVECASNVCDAMFFCATPTCSDGVQNGGETGPDCGAVCGNVCSGGGSTAGCGASGVMCASTETCVDVDGDGVGDTCQSTSGGGSTGGCGSASTMCAATQMCVDTNGDGVGDTCL